MFSRRRTLDRRRKYSREFFETLISRLSNAGFDSIRVVLPHNYESVDPRNSIVPVPAFLERERNYAAIIVLAEATPRHETLKVLLVNSQATAVFVDDTFPSAASEPPALFFQSPDPARAYALFEYFHEYLSEPSVARFVAQSVVGLLSVLLIGIELLAFFGKHRGILSLNLGIHPAWDVAVAAVAMVSTFRFYAQPTGLWIKPRRELRLLYFVKMAVRGELRDNPIVQLAVSIVGGMIVALLARMFGLL